MVLRAGNRGARDPAGRHGWRYTTIEKGITMNSLAWIGIIVWGLVVTAFGLVSASPLEIGQEVAAHDVIFLVSGGLLTCLIGIVGLLGFMGWIPGLHAERKSRA
jgi:hypothetical protein